MRTGTPRSRRPTSEIFGSMTCVTASMLAAQGASLLEIADVLGHKTLAMVKRYSHLVVEHKAKVIEKKIVAEGL